MLVGNVVGLTCIRLTSRSTQSIALILDIVGKVKQSSGVFSAIFILGSSPAGNQRSWKVGREESELGMYLIEVAYYVVTASS